MPAPRVSVVIPTYNYARYLGASIASVLNQRTEGLEVIVVDDGSTDETPAVLEDLAHPRLRVIRTERGGISAARNRGLDEAQGEFVAFQDADDRWRPGKLQRQLEVLLSEPSVGTVFTDFLRFTESGELPNQFTFFPELPHLRTRASREGGARVLESDAFTSLLTFRHYPVYLQSCMMRRDLTQGVRFNPSLRQSEDLHFAMRIYERGGVAYLPDILVEVRRHDNNVSRNLSEKPAWDLQALQLLEQECLPQHRGTVQRRIGRQLAAMGYHSFWEKRTGESGRYYLRSLRYPGSRMK